MLLQLCQRSSDLCLLRLFCHRFLIFFNASPSSPMSTYIDPPHKRTSHVLFLSAGYVLSHRIKRRYFTTYTCKRRLHSFFRSTSQMSVYSSSETSLLLPETSPSDPPLDWQTTFRIARPFVFPSTLLFRLAAILSLLCELLRRAVELLPGYAAKLLVDSLSADDIPNNLWLIAALFVGARIFGSLLNTSKSILYSAVESAGTTRFSVALIEHLLGLSMEFHVKRKSGEILRVWDKGVGAVDSLVETTVFGVFPT